MSHRRKYIYLCVVAISWFQFPAANGISGGVPLVASFAPQQNAPILNDIVPPNILEKSTPQIIKDFPQLDGLEPVSDQKDLPAILQKVGENVEAYFHNFVSTSAQEEVVQQRLRPNGKVEGSLKQKFRYLLVSSGREKDFDLDEFRMDKKGRPAQQKVLWGGTLTKGFASMPALLHPDLQPESRFSLLGRQLQEGGNFLVVAFAQEPATAEFKEKIVGELGTHTVFLQGVVWIDAANFQIVRMSTELLPGPIPQPLIQQTTDITFARVHFEGIPASFWLPQQVAVVSDRVDGRLRNEHRYSDYQLYASQTRMIYQPQ
ncbi:MAG TPA: hypothetical protein VG028_21845 [Terriglobia bacterium]|nr:hypothetical protein [Terriglobia bacterium]